ncbi:ESPR-type extended signal peptide-containing protein [Veillonella atypica]|uniref:ESPR-type extended signal peptide-containing protein n=1 Tax=Veillonella atypica TaxID=39777 RepID=UPI003AF4435A
MNKIFKVVWSKTKECYVVVSEVAKNNGGKKKVLASVLAGLAMVGAGAAGTPVQAVYSDSGSAINISPNAKTGNYAGTNSVVVGYENKTDSDNNNWGRIIYGANNTAAGASTLALGNENEARGAATTAIGVGSKALDKQSVALGNVARATKQGSVAIGSYVNAETTNSGTPTAPVYNSKDVGQYSTAVGSQSWTKGDYSAAYGYQAEATAANAVAIGRVSKATGTSATAVGVNNKAQAQDSSAVGSSNTIEATATQASAFGRENTVNRGATIAAGYKNTADGDRNVAIGNENTTKGEETIGIGTKVIAGTGKTIAIGSVYNPGGGVEKQTIARGDDTINPATGQVNNVFALAIGNGAQADGKDNKASGMIAIGQDVLANNNNTIAMGIQAKATGAQAIAFGKVANASGSGAFALGQAANATSHGSIAMGNGAQSTGSGSTALGRTAKATNDGAVALGFSAEATGDGAIAIGGDGKGAAYDATNTTFAGLGEKTTATAKNAVAIGHQATANIEGGVALGSESKTTKDAGETGYNPAAGRTNKYDNLTNNTKAALTSTRAAVSIGDDSASVTRQLTGLAAGTQDTDAVNVAQLKAVNLKFAGDSTQVTGSTDVRLNDGTFNVNGDGTLISTEATATGIKVKAKVGGTINNTDGKAVKPTTNGIATTDNVADAINDSYWKATAGGNTDGTPAVGKVKPGTQVTYSAGDNLKVKQTINNTTGDQEYKYSLNPVLTGITSIANTATGPKMTFGGNSINITGGSLDMGNNKITNLATGTDDKDAVNVKQLKDTEIHITPGTYTPDSNKKVTLTYENGDNKTVAGKTAVIDLSGLATGGTASTEKVKKAANGANDTNIAEVNPKTGDTFGDAGATYEVSVSRNAVKDAAREAVTINNGGTKSGTTYTPNADNPITVTPKEDAANHNTTYEVTFDGNKAAKQIPLTYKATNNGTTTADQTVKLDKGLNFTGGDYTTASVGADGKVTFDVNLGTAPTVTDGKPGVPGQAGAAGKDGIATVKTVVDTINNSGWKANAKANGGTLVGSSTATVVKPGDQVNFAAGKNLTVKQDLTGEHTYTYSLNKDIDLTNAGSLTVGDTTVNNGGITIKAPTPAAGTTPTTDVKLTNTGLDNGGNKIVNVAEGTADTDAVNVKQLKDAKTVLADGKNTKKSGTGTAADPYKVNVEGDLTGISSITNGGTNNGKISFGPNKTVTVDGDHSITLNASTGKIGGLQNLTFDPTNFTSGQAATEDQLKSVHDTLKASELHIAPTESNRTGEHIAGAATSNTAAGAAANAYKYDATTKQVVLEYNDGTGANKTGTKAVIDLSNLPTGGDMSSFKVTSSAESTTVGTHAGDASQEIKNGKSVDFQAGKNMTVKQTNDTNGNTTINYALNKDLDVESVHVGKDGKDGKIGIDGKDGVDGLDGTNRVDIHVEKGAKGVDGTDGHDGVNGHNGKDGMTRIVYEDKGGKQEVATLNDGMKYAGDDAQGTDKTKVIAKKLNETLDIIGGANKADLTTDNIGVNNDGNGKLLVQLSKNLKGINTIKNGNTTITLNDTPSTTTPAVTITGGNLSLGNGTTNNKIVNVAPGTDDTDAVNVKQLKDAKTVLADGKNTKKSGTGTAADPYKVNVEGDLTEITSITNKADASGNAGKITFSPNQTVTVSGDHNISLNGKTGDITGLTNTTIPTTAGSDFATKGRAATEEQLKIVNDKFNNKINLGADGNTETTKLALDNNGGIKFNIKGDGSGASGANQYISTTASGSDIKVDLTQDAKDKLNKTYDVKSTDKSVTVSSTTTNGVTTFDLKVAPVAGTTSTWDIKSSADTANGGATAIGHETNAKTIANTNSVEMIAGKNLTVKQTSDTNGAKVEFALSDEITVGKDGANGVDGKIGVNGKDGASVVIDGKDGSIGLTGAPGTPGAPGASATLKVKDGVPGVDGAPGTNLTRIVYTDKNNVDHEVATHDDGMKFAGDDGQANQATNTNVIKKHLNNVVDIIGGATKTDLTTNNIGVNNDGNGKLLVQLSKNLNGINTVKNGNTTITLNDAPGGATNTPAVTISGGNLSVGGNKVTNVDDGTDNNDAVNVKQLKAAKTEVKAGKNVVVTSDTNAADGHTTYTVNASTPVVYTTPDGTTKLIKQPDGTFKDENGNAYTGPVIASFEDGTGARTGGNMIVNNVGSAINNHATPGVTSPTYLDKLDAAAGDNNTKNAAVNVTDLKNTKDGLIDKGLKFDANVGGVKTNKLGSTVKVQGAGTSADADYSGTNIKTFISQTGDDTTIDVKLDKNLKGINKISNGGSSITLNDTPSATVPAVTITGGNLSMGDGTTNNKIVNLAPGTADTDAVNVKQLKDTELHITPGTYTPDTNKKVKLTYTDGNGTVVSGKEAVIDLSGLSTGGATASSWNVKSSANTTDGGAVDANHNANAQNIADGKSVEFQSGKNLVVKQTNDTANGNATVEFSLSDKITVGKDGANGKDGSVGAKGADGSAVVMNGKDGSIGLNGTNGANGISIKGKDGANGVGIDGKDGVTRIVYTEKVPDPANPSTTKEVTHEVATMDDGLKFTGNNTGTVNKHKLGSLVKVQGEGVSATDEAAFVSASGNIAVTAENNDTLTIRLNKNLKGLNSIQLGGNTIQSNGDNITFTTNGGTTKTVATTDQLWTIQANGTDVPATNGKVNVVGKDGITVAKNAAGNLEISGAGLGTMNGFDVTANNGATSKTIDNGKKVDFNAGSNLTVKQTNDATGTHIEYALKEAVDLGTNGSLKAGGTTVNKDGVTIANGPSITKTGVDAGSKKITNVADGDVNATSKDAVNGSQLKKYTDAAKTTVEAGDTNVKVETDNSAADGHTNYKVSLEPVVTIGDTHKVKIDGHTGDITGLTNVTLTDPTFATKGRAATEEQLDKVLTEAKKKAVEKVQAGTAAAGDTNIATVAPKAGDTFGAAGATYEVSVSKNAVKDAAKEAVKVTSASPAITVTADTSVAHETTYKVGFDGNQAATQIPLTYKQNGGSARTVKLSDGLNFIDGTNTKARTAADGKVTFDVMGDLTGITSISNAAGGPKMTFGGNSINVTNGDLNMGGNKITNLGKGTATTDAATVGQLTKVTSNNHSVVINKTTDANGAPVYDLAVTGTPGAPAADPRVDMLGEEIGRVGAQGAALSALKPIQYDPLEPTQIMAGYGNYRGNSAVALGVAHYKNESTLIHGGVSWAGGSSHMMANAGVTWKVGNRDSEAAVADRYRKGPISSAYAMQQEMAAMKAQNAGLKGEVSDLKAENEQMKAQIAAMMAKLGL